MNILMGKFVHVRDDHFNGQVHIFLRLSSARGQTLQEEHLLGTREAKWCLVSAWSMAE